MTNADITAIESVIKQFHKFYTELVSAKKDMDFSDSNNLPLLQSKLIEILEHHSLNLHPLNEQGDDQLYREILYLLTVFADEMHIDTTWEGEKIWQDNLLEERIFNSHIAGEMLFRKLETRLQNPNRNSDSVLVIYYLVLCLGFQGKYMHVDKEKKLKYYRKQLYAYLYHTKPFSFDIIKQLFPKAYIYTHFHKGMIKKQPSVVKVSLIVSTIFTAMVLAIIIFLTERAYYSMYTTIKFISRNYGVFIFWIFISLLLIALVYIGLYLYRRNKLKTLPKNSYSRFEIRESFRYTLKLLKTHFGKYNYKYNLPVYLGLGTESSGITSLLNESGIKKILKNPFDDFDLGSYACRWFIYEQAIVLDVASNLDIDNKELPFWKYFVRKIKSKRSRRPLDGIIITISADTFISRDNDSLNNLELIKNKAAQFEGKIMYLQQKIRMKLPVYIIITKSDLIEGFDTFTREIPDKNHNDIFGWSNPYNPNVYSYSKNWITEAFMKINHQISFLMFGFFSNGADIRDFSKIFYFKNNIESIKYPVQIFTNKIFSPNQYSHMAPLLFRGIYFTGSNPMLDEKTGLRNIMFVKDLLEAKVFKEYSLAKPYSHTVFL